MSLPTRLGSNGRNRTVSHDAIQPRHNLVVCRRATCQLYERSLDDISRRSLCPLSSEKFESGRMAVDQSSQFLDTKLVHI
jgi:hypothetical protein